MKALPAAAILFALSGFPVAFAQTAAPGTWSQDQRRCLIAQPVAGGRVVIANDEGSLEIDVQRGEDDSEAWTLLVAFDGGPPIDTTPRDTSSFGLFHHRLGTYGAVAPVFSKAREMAITIRGPNKPDEMLRVPVGQGVQAMTFLKKCADDWRRKNAGH